MEGGRGTDGGWGGSVTDGGWEGHGWRVGNRLTISWMWVSMYKTRMKYLMTKNVNQFLTNLKF